MEIEKIYFDLSGVLADFESGINELCQPIKLDSKAIAKDSELKKWLMVKNCPHFYRKLKPMPGSIDMFLTIYKKHGSKCEILTGLPKPKRGIETATIDKEQWVKHYLPFDIKVNMVYRQDKKSFATSKGCVLVDDYQKSITDWINAGGTGILHKSPKQTIAEIKKLEGK